MYAFRRNQVPLAVGVAVIVVVAVVAAIVGLGSLGSSPTSTASASVSLAPTPSPTDPLSTPENAVRLFFHAFNQGWRTDDPTVVEPYVTGTRSDAYLSVSSFFGGGKAVNKAAVITTEKLDKMTSAVTGDTATVQFDYTVGGYNIALDSGKPIETPNVLAPVHVKVTLKRVGPHWLVDSYVQTS